MAISLNSPLGAGLQGVRNGMERAAGAASDIAAQTTGVGAKDMTTSLVELKLGEVQVAASARVVKSADEMVGSLIDTLA